MLNHVVHIVSTVLQRVNKSSGNMIDAICKMKSRKYGIVHYAFIFSLLL
jgi:hypothetical protein